MTAGEKRSGAFCAPGAGRGGGVFLGWKFPGCDAAAARARPARGPSAGGVPCGFGRYSHSGTKKEAPALAGWGLRKRRFRSLPGRCIISIAHYCHVVKPPWPLRLRVGRSLLGSVRPLPPGGRGVGPPGRLLVLLSPRRLPLPPSAPCPLGEQKSP